VAARAPARVLGRGGGRSAGLARSVGADAGRGGWSYDPYSPAGGCGQGGVRRGGLAPGGARTDGAIGGRLCLPTVGGGWVRGIAVRGSRMCLLPLPRFVPPKRGRGGQQGGGDVATGRRRAAGGAERWVAATVCAREAVRGVRLLR